MNYISMINNFWDYATTNPLPTGQVALYFALMHINNKCNWVEWFQAPNQVLSVLTGMSRSGILKARNELKQKGLIDFRERGTKATSYMLIVNSTQDSVQDSKQIGVQVSTQDSVQDSNTLNKQRYRLKQKDIPPISPEESIGQFLDAYPCSGNQHLTEIAFIDCLMTKQVNEEQLVVAARNYADRCKRLKIDKQYMKRPENFLRDMEYCQYLPGIYEPPNPKGAKNANKGLERADYGDMSDLEKELLSN